MDKNTKGNRRSDNDHDEIKLCNEMRMYLSTGTFIQQIDSDMKQTKNNKHEILGVGGRGGSL